MRAMIFSHMMIKYVLQTGWVHICANSDRSSHPLPQGDQRHGKATCRRNLQDMVTLKATTGT
ncbi:hypothetical protein QWZ13_05200 [Reinekea marina]|uniref:hypothetical protein n=1 Tax=Reinekea marina TaxID=1310421 RepID=UPI0025B3B2FA|nr:hypothetical protein [Reinekea marina]MDN3648302.1 hypothetical protein [Reinekea marina]